MSPGGSMLSPRTPSSVGSPSTGRGVRRLMHSPPVAAAGGGGGGSDGASGGRLGADELLRLSIINRELRVMHQIIFTKDQTLVDAMLRGVIDTWTAKHAAGGFSAVRDTTLHRTLEKIENVIASGQLRLKQVVFFMCLEMCDAMRDYVCSPPPGSSFSAEPNERANCFFDQLSNILAPWAISPFNPTMSSEYDGPADKMRAIALAYSVPTLAVATPTSDEGAVDAKRAILKAREEMKRSKVTMGGAAGGGGGTGMGAVPATTLADARDGDCDACGYDDEESGAASGRYLGEGEGEGEGDDPMEK